jgi:ferrochelatase
MPSPVPAAGVLLSNMGSPSAPTPSAVREYLREFLSDPAIVDLPRLLWLPLLHGIILRTRPKRVARLYASVWTSAGAPLTAITRRQASALEASLGLPVAVGMRYGSPSITEGLRELRDRGCGRVLGLPLYPQYSRATTGSTLGAFREEAARLGFGEVFAVEDYHDRPGYIEALAASVSEFQAAHGAPDRLLASFHGMPAKSVTQGDPYYEQCKHTASLLSSAFRLPSSALSMAFQSRFGPARWLQPYTDEVLKGWAREGVGAVHTICPGFAADCLETLEEVGAGYRKMFLEHGGKEFHYIAALNDRPDHIAFLASLARPALA